MITQPIWRSGTPSGMKMRLSSGQKFGHGQSARVNTGTVGGGVALLARGIWWRRWASLVLVLCASVTVAGATAGPLWGRAAQASLLERTLQQARVSELAWTATGNTSAYGELTALPPAPQVVESDVETGSQLPPVLDRLFDEATEVLSTARRLQVVPEPAEHSDVERESLLALQPPLGSLVAREGACARVELVSGTCPTKRTDLLLSDRSAKELGIGAGDRVRLPELSERSQPGDRHPGTYTVSGVYRAETVAPASRFWFDSEVLEYAPPVRLGSESLPARLDAVLVRPELIRSFESIGVQVRLERMLRPRAITLANADRVARQLTEKVVNLNATSRTVEGSASLAETVAESVGGRQLVADTATFVGLQVVVFGWVVLFGLVAVSVAARDAELALAKLRGLRGARLAVHALTEPVCLVLVSVPLGLLGAWAAVGVLARRVLLPGTPVIVPPGVWSVIGASAGGCVLACVLAAGRSVRMPVADQLRRQSPQPGAAGPIATAVLLTLAGVGLVLVHTLGRGAQAALPALLTPVVVGLAAGLIVGWAVQIVMRVGVARTRRWSLAPYLAVRQLARQASLTHTTALVTVATAVSGFAAGAYVVTATQREAQARLDVGADRVAHVARVRTADLLAASREADPQGRWAMAAVQRGDGTDGLLAVDSARFDVAFGIPRGALARPRPLDELVPARMPQPLVVRGSTATIKVAASYLYSRTDVRAGVQLRVVTVDGQVKSTMLGALDSLGHGRTLTAKVPACAKGCTVASVFVARRAGLGEISGSVELVSLRIGGKTYPFAASEWRPARVNESAPDSTTTSTLAPREGTLDGVRIGFEASPSIVPGIVRRDTPTELPAIVGEQTQLSLIGTRQLVRGNTLEGDELPFAIAGRTPVVPHAGGGSMVDLELVSRVQPPRGSELDFQVWLGTRAPADAPQRLSAAGLKVIEVESRAVRRGELDRAEPARAQLLLLGAGGAVLLAGVAGIATVLAAAARRRAVESAALHAMAVPGRVVRGSAVLEDVLLLLPGVLAGAGCAAALVNALSPVLAEVTGAAVAVSGPPATSDVVLPVLAASVVTALLLVPVVLMVTRPAGDETSLRVAT
jgi:putative ABC transport system permease protein